MASSEDNSKSVPAENEGTKPGIQSRPSIRLRSLSTLIASNNGLQPNYSEQRGRYLRKALKKTLIETTNSVKYSPRVDVFESIMNGKVTFSSDDDGTIERKLKEKSPPKHIESCCHECDDMLYPTTLFGKVYHSGNDKNFNHNSMKSSPTKAFDIPGVSDKLKEGIRVGIDIPSTNPNSQIPEVDCNVPSLFGKVYTKKISPKYDYIRVSQDTSNTTSIDLLGKRKRGD